MIFLVYFGISECNDFGKSQKTKTFDDGEEFPRWSVFVDPIHAMTVCFNAISSFCRVFGPLTVTQVVLTVINKTSVCILVTNKTSCTLEQPLCFDALAIKRRVVMVNTRTHVCQIVP